MFMSIAPSQLRRGARRSCGAAGRKASASRLPPIYIHRQEEILRSLCSCSSSRAQLDVRGVRCRSHGSLLLAVRSIKALYSPSLSRVYISVRRAELSRSGPSPPRLRSYYIQSGSALAACIISAGRWQLLRPRRSRSEINIRCVYCFALPSPLSQALSISWLPNHMGNRHMLHFCF